MNPKVMSTKENLGLLCQHKRPEHQNAKLLRLSMCHVSPCRTAISQCQKEIGNPRQCATHHAGSSNVLTCGDICMPTDCSSRCMGVPSKTNRKNLSHLHIETWASSVFVCSRFVISAPAHFLRFLFNFHIGGPLGNIFSSSGVPGHTRAHSCALLRLASLVLMTGTQL